MLSIQSGLPSPFCRLQNRMVGLDGGEGSLCAMCAWTLSQVVPVGLGWGANGLRLDVAKLAPFYRPEILNGSERTVATNW